MTRIITAMVFAAGFGQRMQPLSLTTPKPLLPLLGRPLLQHVVDHLRAVGVQRVIINSHYLAEQIADFCRLPQPPMQIIHSHEKQILETGGGLVQAKNHLGHDPIFVINGDCYWRNGAGDSLAGLAGLWDGGSMDSLLLLQPQERAIGYDGVGDFCLMESQNLGRVSRRGQQATAPLVYSGIQILNPMILRNYPREKFSLNRIWDDSLAQNRLFGTVHGGDWYHLSTPADLAVTESLLQNL
ncbi:MAG: nucleotidyltransferase family protein [Candidatus Pacebacteria bacterium]|nr:nucleotidyltransferase family protein [Candidatus Paceibacterota bacterium]